MEPYTWALDRACAREFETLEPQERRQICEFLDSLARHPFHDENFPLLGWNKTPPQVVWISCCKNHRTKGSLGGCVTDFA